MVTNLLKIYPQLLDLTGTGEKENRTALYLIFERDFVNNPLVNFRGKKINPTPKDGEIPMETLYRHLTTVVVDLTTRKREFDSFRSIRLHWVLHHLMEKTPANIDVFSTQDKEGYRTYIYDKVEKFIIVLEPMRKVNEYYLLSAYYLRGGDGKKIENKRKRKLAEIL